MPATKTRQEICIDLLVQWNHCNVSDLFLFFVLPNKSKHGVSDKKKQKNNSLGFQRPLFFSVFFRKGNCFTKDFQLTNPGVFVFLPVDWTCRELLEIFTSNGKPFTYALGTFILRHPPFHPTGLDHQAITYLIYLIL